MIEKKIASTLLFLFFYINANAQKTIETASFDEIFKEYENSAIPGVVAGVIDNGEVIYLKGFGNADVQNKIKITPQTKFQIDDLAKQFTVLAILLLEQEGKISFEDDVRKYIPELPKYKSTLRIKHLLNHSSGLNNLSAIKELCGIRLNDVFTQRDALKLIGSQKKLNFIPGTDFSYLSSDSELILFAEIVAKASKKSFIEYTSENVFKPLQMTNTIFNNKRDLLENTAFSYRVGDQIKYNPVNDLTLGATNLYTSAEDLTKWYLNYTAPTSLIGQLVEELDVFVTLDNGNFFNSSWGKMTYGRYFEHSERGLPKMWQYGLIGGYASNMFRFHTKGLITFVIGNNNRYNGSLAMQLANEFLENEFLEPPSIDFSKVKIKETPNKVLKKHEGFYWNKKNGLARQVYLKNDTLRYNRLESDRETLLLPLGDNIFQFMVDGDDEIILKFNNEKRTYSIVIGGSDEILYNEYEPLIYSNDKLSDFVGTFYNKELAVVYTFTKENEIIKASNLRNGVTQFYPIKKDIFRSNTLMFLGIKFARNSKNKVIGFNINTDAVIDLWFAKIKP